LSDSLPRDEPPDWRAIWQKAREKTSAQREVVRTVGARRGELARNDMRILFDEEMKRRGLAPDPIWVERKLDELEWSASERMRERTHSVKVLAGIASGLARSLGGKGVGGTLGHIVEYGSAEQDPEWMQPPGIAIYRPSPSLSEKVAVVLDVEAESLLDRAFETSPRRLAGQEGILMDVWLSKQPASDEVVVNLGQQRIGTLSVEISQRLVPVMEAAAKQRMNPRLNAKLVRAEHVRPPYLLVVKVPVSGTSTV
jgi:hypothetical protein